MSAGSRPTRQAQWNPENPGRSCATASGGDDTSHHHPPPQFDLADAIQWYESRQPDLSYDFRLALDASLNLIARHPDSCAPVAPQVRRALMRRFPHAVYYRWAEAAIEIIAILHTRRSPRLWRARNH